MSEARGSVSVLVSCNMLEYLLGHEGGESRGVVEEGQRVVEVDLGAGTHCRGGPWGKILVVGSGIVRGSSVDP